VLNQDGESRHIVATSTIGEGISRFSASTSHEATKSNTTPITPKPNDPSQKLFRSVKTEIAPRQFQSETG